MRRAGGLSIDYRAGGIEATGDARFDLVTCLEVIEHVVDREAFVAGLAGAIAPGGLLVMSTPNRTPLSRVALIGIAEGTGRIPRGTHDWHACLTPDELTTLLTDAGLRVIDTTGAGAVAGQGVRDGDIDAARLFRDRGARLGRMPGPSPLPVIDHGHTRGWRTLGLLMLVALAARAITIGNPVVHADEEFYFSTAHAMWRGALPYVDVWDRKPIGLFLLYLPAAALPWPWGIVGYQAMAFACVVATAALIVRLARRAGWTRGAVMGGRLYPVDRPGGGSGRAGTRLLQPVDDRGGDAGDGPGRSRRGTGAGDDPRDAASRPGAAGQIFGGVRGRVYRPVGDGAAGGASTGGLRRRWSTARCWRSSRCCRRWRRPPGMRSRRAVRCVRLRQFPLDPAAPSGRGRRTGGQFPGGGGDPLAARRAGRGGFPDDPGGGADTGAAVPVRLGAGGAGRT